MIVLVGKGEGEGTGEKSNTSPPTCCNNIHKRAQIMPAGVIAVIKNVILQATRPKTPRGHTLARMGQRTMVVTAIVHSGVNSVQVVSNFSCVWNFLSKKKEEMAHARAEPLRYGGRCPPVSPSSYLKRATTESRQCSLYSKKKWKEYMIIFLLLTSVLRKKCVCLTRLSTIQFCQF